MKRYAILYKQYILQYIKSLIEYRADFILGLIGFSLVQCFNVVFITLIFNNIPSLSGWSFYQVLFIYGFAQIPRGIDHIFTDNLWMLCGDIVVNGKFDKYLIRPLNPLFQVIAENFQPDGFGELIVGIVLTILSASKLNLHLSFYKIIILLFAIICGCFIYTAVKLAISSIVFWIKYAQSYLLMTYQLSNFVKYPMEIYPKVIRGILTFIIPFAFTGYYPGAYFLGKESFYSGILLTFIITLVAVLISYTIWLKGIDHYESSGS